MSLTVIHLTSANEVNEKTKVIHDAAAIAGVKIGIHRFFSLERKVTPLGNSNSCSSKLGFRVDKTGSQNRIIKWLGVGSHDEIHYLNGWIFERKFCKWYEGIGYDFKNR